MCGITAIIGEAAESDGLIDEMTRAIAHRGPDGSGTFSVPGCALGHRRLAVIDLSELAAQPMRSDDGEIVIVYNAEVYNFQELRRELEQKGRSFRSRSDTEVVLRLYEEIGDACVERLNGMFAFVIWDGHRKRALVARDRFGQKPLFYAEVANTLYVASEIKALLRAPAIPRDISLTAIDAYLTSNWVPAPLTFYSSISRLEPGEMLVKEHGRPARRRRYTPARPAPATFSYREALERADVLMTAAVERQLVADVPVGLFLSGGIDSSLILSRAARRLPGGVDAYTVAFAEHERSELQFAEKAAASFGARLHTVFVGPNDFRSPESLIRMFDEPFADVATLAVAKLCREARRSITVALTGDGGDELFGGYELHLVGRYAAQLGLGGRFRRWLAWLGESVPESAGFRSPLRLLKRGLALAADDWRAATQRLRANVSRDERQELLTPDALGQLRGNDPYAHLLPRDPIGVEALFDPLADRVLGDLFLHKTDITSMASGLECRSPFLDVPLSEFARSLPIRYLVRGITGKRIPRDLVSAEVDPGLGRRRKMGFSPPLDSWLRGELSHLLDDWLGGAGRLVYEFVARPEVERRVAEHRSGRANHRRVLWSLILLEAWLEGARTT